MLNISRSIVVRFALLFSLCTLLYASSAFSDPSGRVAYLSDTQGQVSYSPSGEDRWFDFVRNRPLIRGDRLWTDRRALAELQIGSSAIRLASNTGVEILDLDDRFAQLQLTEGSLSLTVRRLYKDQVIEVDTPLLAFVITRAGRYRIDVDPQYDETTIVVWEGAGEAYGDDSNFSLRAGDTVRFYDTDLRDYEMFRLPRMDDLDRYSRERDLYFQRSASLRYIDDDLVGYADLDEYGSWRRVSGQGHVWFPYRVEAGWAPYRYGHWVWQEPWGWTWIDNAPWGFAPSHYGRWVFVHNRWGWVPGPRNVRPVYAPALVAFVGGSSWSMSLSLGGGRSAVGWFPLGPREVYVPSYYGSRDYFNRVNQNNTVINNTTITNVYNNYSNGTINVNQVNYANRTRENAVTAVPREVFVDAQPVRQARLRYDANSGKTGEVLRVAPVAPTEQSVFGAGKAAKVRPEREVFDRDVVAHRAPPPKSSSFAKREQLLQKNPGRPLEPAVAESFKGNNGKPAKNVRMVNTQKQQVDARNTGPHRVDESAQPQQLDRSDQDKKGAKRTKKDTQPDNGQQQRKADNDEQAQRKADNDKQAAEELRRKADKDKQAAEQQQRKADNDKQAAEQQQRKADNDRQAAEQQQRKADNDRQAAEQQQRKADNDRQAAEQQQRKAASDRQAAEQQQRKADNDRQAAEQQQRKAASDRQAAEQQQRKAASDRQAAEQQQRKAASDRQAAEQQQRKAASDRQAAEQQQRKATSDRQAAEQQQRKVASDSQAVDESAAQQPQPQQNQSGKEQHAKSKAQEECEREARKQGRDDSACQDIK